MDRAVKSRCRLSAWASKIASRVAPSRLLPGRTGAAGSLKCRSSSAGVVIRASPPDCRRWAVDHPLRGRWPVDDVPPRAPSEAEVAVGRELGHVHLGLLQPARV